ncbi:contactin-1 isoform X2 [Phyllobates terribilis]|uniref:contactin-1 isoform X2 n=1 Tax=Phyllobates terribilis TaxID=111132 RepID=UPI003CCB4EB9
MWPVVTQLLLYIFFCRAEEGKRYGPVFEEQPIDTIHPQESTDGKISMNCRARANPTPIYRWRYNNWEIDFLNPQYSTKYSMIGGNLVINDPQKSKDSGKYICIVSNDYGTVKSMEASLNFGHLDPYPVEERPAVKVKEGTGVMLICDPPPHFPDDLNYRWIINEFPNFITMDSRKFITQKNGNLYIAKVEQSDRGNYSCFVSSPSITKSVFSSSTSLLPQSEASKRYAADIQVAFSDTYALKEQNVTLECFALGNPVPVIRWRKVNEPMPTTAEVSASGAVLRIFNIQPEDEGTYECEAENIKGRDTHKANVYVQAPPEWVEHINDTERDIGSDLHWPCIAKGKPIPTIRWLKNGESYGKGELKIRGLTMLHAGMYQCIAENHYGLIQANAELKILALAPTFELNPMRKQVLAAKGGRVIIECKPKAAPKPKFSWSKGTELLMNDSRVAIWDDGSLEILNITMLDEGSYTCFAENNRGKANSTTTLSVKAATKITLAPSNADVSVGENATIQCHASHDPGLEIEFIWTLNGFIIETDGTSYYEEHIRSTDNDKCELIIKNVQLRHAGRYTCTAQSIVDNSSASADLVVRGPPGPPGGVRTEEIRDTSVKLTWSSGTDNHQPISKYTIQAKTSLSEEWKDVKTAPTEAPTEVTAYVLSSTEARINWQPVIGQTVTGYQIRYWRSQDKEAAAHRVQIEQSEEPVRLEGLMANTLYHLDMFAFNSAGDGPRSKLIHFHTSKAPPSQKPIITAVKSGSQYIITWDHVKPLYNESKVLGYKVLYKPAGQHAGTLYSTGDHRLEVPIPREGECVVEVRAHSEGGDGEVAYIKLTSDTSGMFPSIIGILLPTFGLLVYLEF